MLKRWLGPIVKTLESVRSTFITMRTLFWGLPSQRNACWCQRLCADDGRILGNSYARPRIKDMYQHLLTRRVYRILWSDIASMTTNQCMLGIWQSLSDRCHPFLLVLPSFPCQLSDNQEQQLVKHDKPFNMQLPYAQWSARGVPPSSLHDHASGTDLRWTKCCMAVPHKSCFESD